MPRRPRADRAVPATLTALGLLVAAVATHAAGIGVVPTKLIVVDKTVAAGKAKAVFVAKDPAATKGAGLDVEQISVQLDVAYGNGSAAGAFTLPAGASVNKSPGWLVNKATVAKYVNKTAPDGPTGAKVAVIKPGKLLKLVGKSVGDVPLDILGAGDPAGPVHTAYCVTNGAEETCHCSEFTGCTYKPIAGGTGAKLVCKGGGGDTSCLARCRDDDSVCPAGCGAADDDCVSGCFVDLGVTVLDTCTSLEWEKKETAPGSGAEVGNLQDVDNRYSWAGECTNTGADCQPNAAAAATCAAQTGDAVGCVECGAGEGTCDVDPSAFNAITTIWDWVNQLNATSFAGHTDWRLPTSAGCCGTPTGEAAELESVIDASAGLCGGGVGACIDGLFGPTNHDRYWSASTHPPTPLGAVCIAFGDGSSSNVNKGGSYWIRAVRPAS